MVSLVWFSTMGFGRRDRGRVRVRVRVRVRASVRAGTRVKMRFSRTWLVSFGRVSTITLAFASCLAVSTPLVPIILNRMAPSKDWAQLVSGFRGSGFGVEIDRGVC